MENRKEVLSYMIYMANKWSRAEAVHVFGDILGDHIFKKYIDLIDDEGYYGAYAKLIFELSESNVDKLVARATELYNGRANRN